MRGVFVVRKTKVSTGKIVYEQEVPNSLTGYLNVRWVLDFSYGMPLANGASLALCRKAMHSGAPFYASYTTGATPIDEMRTSSTFVKVAEYIPPGADAEHYLYQVRFDPPTAEETYYGAVLFSYRTDLYPYATVSFNSPCTQGPDEYLDVYYKLYVDFSTVDYLQTDNAAAAFTKVYITSDWPSYTDVWYNYLKCSTNNLPLSKGGFESPILSFSINHSPVDFGINKVDNLSLSLTSYPGRLIGRLCFGDYFTLYVTKSRPSTVSALQNVFTRNGVATAPYSSSAQIGSSAGVVSFNDNGWGPKTNLLASLFRVEFVSGGDNTTATYRFYRRYLSGTHGNTWDTNVVPIPTLPAHKSGYTDPLFWSIGHSRDITTNYLPGTGNPEGVTKLSIGGDTLSDSHWMRNCVIYKYIFPEWITVDKYGLTIHDLAGNSQPLSGTTTPALPASSITQIAHDSVGNIYVACKQTGLYKISKVAGSPATGVTKLTGTGIANPNSCRGVQIGDNDSIWALFGEEMCHSTDGGATWTVYNETTTPQFMISGRTSGGDLSGAVGIVRKESTGENKFVIFAPNSEGDGVAYWWSLEGSATTSDALQLTITDALKGPTYQLWPIVKAKFLSNGVLIVTDKSNIGYYTSYYQFGAAAPDTNFQALGSSNGYAAMTSGAISIIEHNGTPYLIGRGPSASSRYTIVARNVDTREGPSSYSYLLSERSSGVVENGELALWMNGAAYIGHGVCIIPMATVNYGGQIELDGSGTYPVFAGFVIRTLGGPESGDGLFGFGDVWESYGWDGSSWVLGNTTPKTMHAGYEDLVDNIQVAFQNTVGGPSDFLAGEYVDAYVYDGILKDDATTLDFSNISFPIFPTVTGGEYSSSLVPAAPTTFTDTYVMFMPTFVKFYYDKRPTLPPRLGEATCDFPNYDDNSMYVTRSTTLHPMSGNFSVEFEYSDAIELSEAATFTESILDSYPLTAGILGLIAPSGINQSGTIDPSELLMGIRLWHSSNDGSEKKFVVYLNGARASNIITVTGNDQYDKWMLRRTNDTFEVLLNNNVVWSSTGAPLSDVVLATNYFVNHGSSYYDESQYHIREVKVTCTVNRKYVFIGGNGTGKGPREDQRFMAMPVYDAQNYQSITLDGVPVTYVTDQVTPPAQGQVHILRDGTLWFNDADAGKTLGGEWMYLRRWF